MINPVEYHMPERIRWHRRWDGRGWWRRTSYKTGLFDLLSVCSQFTRTVSWASREWSAASAAGGTETRTLVLCPSHTLGSCTVSPTPDLTKSKLRKISTGHNSPLLRENATNHTLKTNLTYRHTYCRSSCNGIVTGHIRVSRILTHRS